MLIVCPTVDYEIYFGRNALSAHDVLFEPTRKLLALWARHNIRATLFPDICSVWRHRELGMNDYVDAFEAQVKQARADGHDVQLHLHPEWRRAEHRDGGWCFQPGTQALHDLGFSRDDPDGAPALIRRGKQYLEALLRPVDPGYQCIAFRAGGWILQPEASLVSALLAEGIRVDATVIPGMKSPRSDYDIDFRRVPDQATWFIDPARGLGTDAQRHEYLLEISIASYRGRFPVGQHVLNQLRLRKRAAATREAPRGYPMTRNQPRAGLITRAANKYRKLMVPRVLDIADTHESMLATLRSYLRHYDCRGGDIAVCMNGHSKDTYDYHLAELERFFETVQRDYRDVVAFQTLEGYVSRAYPGLVSKRTSAAS
jgi:hypothetical protein